MNKEMIYLDYNATAPLRKGVKRAMLEAFDHYGNPSSVHTLGRKARALIENSREIIADSVGVAPNQVIFTSGGTEANNLALSNGPTLASAIEHESVAHLTNKTTPVNKNGTLDLDAFKSSLMDKSQVAVMLANNETGVVQPINDVVKIANDYNASVHCDAVQAFGKISFNFVDLGVDTLALSAHKIGGPKGIGALIVRQGLQLPALIRGGGQERGARAGTENIIGVVGFAAAVELAPKDNWNKTSQLRDDMEEQLLQRSSTIPIYGKQSPRLPNTSCIGMPGVTSQTQVMAFDLAGICLSAGSACSSGKITASKVLQEMGATETEAAIRVSLGWDTTAEEIEKFITVWSDLYKRNNP